MAPSSPPSNPCDHHDKAARPSARACRKAIPRRSRSPRPPRRPQPTCHALDATLEPPPSGTLRLGTPFSAAFIPLVPEASSGRLGMFRPDIRAGDEYRALSMSYPARKTSEPQPRARRPMHAAARSGACRRCRAGAPCRPARSETDNVGRCPSVARDRRTADPALVRRHSPRKTEQRQRGSSAGPPTLRIRSRSATLLHCALLQLIVRNPVGVHQLLGLMTPAWEVSVVEPSETLARPRPTCTPFVIARTA